MSSSTVEIGAMPPTVGHGRLVGPPTLAVQVMVLLGTSIGWPVLVVAMVVGSWSASRVWASRWRSPGLRVGGSKLSTVIESSASELAPLSLSTALDLPRSAAVAVDQAVDRIEPGMRIILARPDADRSVHWDAVGRAVNDGDGG